MDIIRVALGIVMQDGRCLVAQRLEKGPFERLVGVSWWKDRA